MISRRRFMNGAGGTPGALYAGGSFTGDGTITAVLNIGFEPDVVLINSDLDFFTSGWVGIGKILIWKNTLLNAWRHTAATANNITSTPYTGVSNDFPYGDPSSAGQYAPYATYNEGVLTVTNKSTAAGVVFKENQIYTWQAFKAPEVTP